MQGVLASGYADWPIIHQIAWLLGKLMNGIYNVLEWIIRNPEHWYLHHYFYNYYLYVDDPAYDQTAEMVEDVICHES